MKYRFACLLLALAVSEISGYRLQHDKEVSQKEDRTDGKFFQIQNDNFQGFNHGKDAIRAPRALKDIGKVRQFDVDFHGMRDHKLEHDKPVREFKVKPFQSAAGNYKIGETRTLFSDKERFEHRPVQKAFQFDAKSEELKLEKPKYREVIIRPSHDFKQVYKQKPSAPFKHHRSMEKSRERLQAEKFKTELRQLEQNGYKLAGGHKLMEAGLNKIDNKYLDNSFNDVHEEYDQLEDNMNYLQEKDHSLNDAEYFLAPKEHLKLESDKFIHGNEIMDNGFQQIDTEQMSPRFDALVGEFGRLDESREKLDDSEIFITDLNMENRSGNLQNNRDGLIPGKSLIDDQFAALQNNGLNKKYDAIESGFD